jgi:glutamate---methylamine ligase
LLDALRALQASKLLNESLGEYVPAYLKLKHQEWDDFSRHLTDWERDATLDC